MMTTLKVRMLKKIEKQKRRQTVCGERKNYRHLDVSSLLFFSFKMKKR